MSQNDSQVYDIPAIDHQNFMHQQSHYENKDISFDEVVGNESLTHLNVPFSDNYKSWQAEMNDRLRNIGAASEMQ